MVARINRRLGCRNNCFELSKRVAAVAMMYDIKASEWQCMEARRRLMLIVISLRQLATVQQRVLCPQHDDAYRRWLEFLFVRRSQRTCAGRSSLIGSQAASLAGVLCTVIVIIITVQFNGVLLHDSFCVEDQTNHYSRSICLVNFRSPRERSTEGKQK